MIFCSECGKKNHEDATFCISCGDKIKRHEDDITSNQPTQNSNSLKPNKPSLKAFTSLLLGVLSFVSIFIMPGIPLSLILAIIGIVFGLIGMKEVDEFYLNGKSTARIGIVLNIATLMIWLFYLLEM